MSPPFRLMGLHTDEADALMRQDAQLLERGKSPDFPLTFHAYRWSRPCITYGYLQKPEKFCDIEWLRSRNVPLVRRPTGGKVALHGHDLAYSITAHLKGGEARQQVMEWIERIAEALRRLKIPVVVGAPRSRDAWHQPLCGVERGPADLLLEGRKLAGHAFRRAGRALQLQGTLALKTPDHEIQTLAEGLTSECYDLSDIAQLDSFGIRAEQIVEVIASHVERT